MALRGALAFTAAVLAALAVRAEAQTPCPEYVQLRNAANEAWKQAMSVPRPERCGALHHASSAAEATLNYANSNHEACGISDRLLSQVEGYYREAERTRGNACAGRPLREYPPDVIRR